MVRTRKTVALPVGSAPVTTTATTTTTTLVRQSKRHECQVCHRHFRGKRYLSVHSRVHQAANTSSTTTAVTVPSPPATTSTIVATPHLDTDIEQQSKAFACLDCDKRYRFAHGLRNHRQIHLGFKPHVCDHCHKAFTQRTFLTIHLRSHTDERPFACSKCGKAFHQRSHLRYHLLTHSQRRGFVCPICGTRLRYKQSLQLHLRIHGASKPFICDTCGKAFFEKPKLKIHQRTHSGEKPYACDLCFRKFAQKGNRDKHLKRYHARDRERKFPCTLCPKAFIWKKCLDMHLTWHRLQDNKIKSPRLSQSTSSLSPTSRTSMTTETAGAPPPQPSLGCRRRSSSSNPGPNGNEERSLLHDNVDEEDNEDALVSGVVSRDDRDDVKQLTPLDEAKSGQDDDSTTIGGGGVKRETTTDGEGDDAKVLTSYQNGEWVVVPRVGEEAPIVATRRGAEREEDVGLPAADDERDGETGHEELESDAPDGGSLRDNMKRLLPHLLDEEVLQEIGWPDVRVERMVAQVLRWCDQKPAASNRHDEDDVFECNVQLLLNIVLEEKFTEAGDLRGMSSNDILRELLKLSVNV